MLDKTVPYAELWMTRPLEAPVPPIPLADGFHFEYYDSGAEADWAAIETAVGEFEDEKKALAYFQQNFAPYPEELKKRMLFVVTEKGDRIATCTAWQKKRKDGSFPVFHWLAVMPDYQGKGLAKALTAATIRNFQQIAHAGPIYLHTQTWSHPAISLYEKLGFTSIDKNFDGSSNPEYEKAMHILTTIKSRGNQA
ncbi:MULTISPECIES: GNAT family N-acetyltransferase [unclassified Enterococcus]|uniref:GNAT family N-acetyltransferase n=1 Tax=unclassified Enterococcus TaxID=2608891 RepID=UPI0013ECBF62|nr:MULTISPECIES: GNAT family N-acetyltransferase [unclassified Enterococcus]